MELSVQHHERAREAATRGRSSETRAVLVHRLHTALLLLALTMGTSFVILQTR